MMDGLLKTIAQMAGVKPEDMREMMMQTYNNVRTVTETLGRIEAHMLETQNRLAALQLEVASLKGAANGQADQ